MSFVKISMDFGETSLTALEARWSANVYFPNKKFQLNRIRSVLYQKHLLVFNFWLYFFVGVDL